MQGEEIVFKTTKHWMSPLADSGVAILLLIAAVVLAWLQTDQTNGVMGFVNRLLNLLEIAFVVFGIGSIIYNIVAWRSAEYVVTSQRVLGQEGLLRRRETDSLLSSISDVRSRSSAVGRMLGYGDLQILSASGDAGADKFTTVIKADDLKKKILEQKIAAGNAPTPSMAATEAAASASAAVTSPNADTMATLSGLAGLRDSGAISAEEYEAKKAELLSRI
jgi:uncharacterized membrane protein YdbT with pleckstrin-like domain